MMNQATVSFKKKNFLVAVNKQLFYPKVLYDSMYFDL